MLVKPTARWNAIAIPVPGVGTVTRRQSAVPVEVPDAAADFLFSNMLAIPAEISEQLDPLGNNNPPPADDDSSENDSQPDSLATWQEKALAFFADAEADAIADAIKGVGVATAQKLVDKRSDGLTWVEVEQSLSRQQLSAVQKWAESSEA